MSFIITEFPVSIGMNYTEIYQIQDIHGLIIAIILLKTFWKKQTVSSGRIQIYSLFRYLWVKGTNYLAVATYSILRSPKIIVTKDSQVAATRKGTLFCIQI